MDKKEYNFLMGRIHPQSYDFDEAFEFCRNFGWCAGLDTRSRPVLTKRGVKAVKAFQVEESQRLSKETV